MKWITAIACFLLMSGCNTLKQNTSSGIAEIRAAMEQSARDWNGGRLDQYMTLYDSAATFMFSTGPVGLEGIRDNYQKVFFNGKQPKQQLKYEDLVIRPLGKDYALLTGKFVLSGNGLKERRGIYTLVFVRRANGWKVLHDHSS